MWIRSWPNIISVNFSFKVYIKNGKFNGFTSVVIFILIQYNGGWWLNHCQIGVAISFWVGNKGKRYVLKVRINHRWVGWSIFQNVNPKISFHILVLIKRLLICIPFIFHIHSPYFYISLFLSKFFFPLVEDIPFQGSFKFMLVPLSPLLDIHTDPMHTVTFM